MSAILEALAREVGAVGKALHRFGVREWEAPTRCAPMTVKDLVAHTVRGADRLNELLAAGAVDAEPEKDRLTYWRYDPKAEGPQILARAQAEATAMSSAELVARWDREWVHALQGARAALASDDPVLPHPLGLIRLSDFLTTRCVEVVVHHMDIDDAVDELLHPDPGALQVVCDVLRGLLGTDARRLGIEDVRFTLIGTGRAPLSDTERELFGPLAEKFPLLA